MQDCCVAILVLAFSLPNKFATVYIYKSFLLVRVPVQLEKRILCVTSCVFENMPPKRSVQTHLNVHYRCFSSPQLLGLWAERKTLTFCLAFLPCCFVNVMTVVYSLSCVWFVSALPGNSAIKRLRHSF